jgi:hypothetical protein
MVDPPTVALVGRTVKFAASVGGLQNKNVNWTASAGEIDQTGNFTAPMVAQVVTVTATAVANPNLRASAQVSVKGIPDGCTATDPQLLGFANAFGGPAQGAAAQYDLNGDGRVDDADLAILFRGMGWM